VVVDALGRGEQILILRKGGISEGRGGFAVEHNRFLLFPTLFHQQRESVIPSAQTRFDAIAATLPPADRVHIEFFCDIVATRQLESPDAARRLQGQHIWREEVIDERFDWGQQKGIYALAVRVHRLAASLELPVIAAYGGCKSWIELEREIATDGATPVLPDKVFDQKLAEFTRALEPVNAP
jgi:hypothetical protein